MRFVVLLLLLLALWTRAPPEPTLAPGKTIAAWDFTKASDELAPNSIPGMPDLKAGRETPGVVKDGMQFNNGGRLECPVASPASSTAKPLSSSPCASSPCSCPSGYCGGLFQCFEYNKAGFRFYLFGNMRLGCDIYPAGRQASSA